MRRFRFRRALRHYRCAFRGHAGYYFLKDLMGFGEAYRNGMKAYELLEQLRAPVLPTRAVLPRDSLTA